MKIGNPWVSCNDVYVHNNVYYYIWKRKEENDCVWFYNCTQEPDRSPSETAGGYASKHALIKAKFGIDS